MLSAAIALVLSLTVLPVASRIGDLGDQIDTERLALGRFEAMAALKDKVADMQRAGRAAGESGAYLKGQTDALRFASLQGFLSELAGANSVRLASTRALPPLSTSTSAAMPPRDTNSVPPLVTTAAFLTAPAATV